MLAGVEPSLSYPACLLITLRDFHRGFGLNFGLGVLLVVESMALDP